MKRLGKLFMAFSKGKEEKDVDIRRYVGIATVNVLAVNPSKAALEKLYDTTLEKEPEYLSENNGVPAVRLDFIVRTVPEKSGNIDMTTKVSFFLRKESRTNSDNTKVQVIDKYGRTAWVTKEEYKTHAIPQYASGPANLDADYRAIMGGEESLTNFLKTFLGIPNVQRFVDGKWIMADNPEECEARISDIEALFKGDYRELREALALQPNNTVKAMFGIRSTNDGKQYQTAFTEGFARGNSRNVGSIEKALNERKSFGAYATTEFSSEVLHEYVVSPTDFSSSPSSPSSPFGDETGDNGNSEDDENWLPFS